MTLEDVVVRYWPQFLTTIGVIIWAVRLEAGLKSNMLEIRRMQHQRNEDQQAHKEARDATNHKIDQIRDDIKELRGDIKELLRMEGSR